ncbi:outer membrane protein TolC [Dysgonomonadaceae bacterium PH5-43]|nr:outer membrane protein TolC [Dysgonomonadaceae bacterium PH5-43]
MKIRFVILLVCVSVLTTYAQLTIEKCFEMAEQNYPQIKRYNLISQSESYSLSNASKAYMPQLYISGKATYQTDVTSIPISMPSIDIPTINKDQYQIVAEVNQTIFDGGVTKSQKQIIEAEHLVDKSQLDVEMYAIRERVNEIFFGILMIDERLSLNSLYLRELNVNLNKINTAYGNGTATQVDIDVVKVEIKQNTQQRIELESLRKSYSNMLAYFVGLSTDDNIYIVRPKLNDIDLNRYSGLFADSDIATPEINYFHSNINLLEVQKKKINSANLPKLGAFIQAGYANPALNMLKEGFRAYAVGGLKLSWNISNLYTKNNDYRKIDNAIKNTMVLQDVYLFNSRIKIIQQQEAINSYRKKIEEDDDIIVLRKNIRLAAENKIEFGIINSTDIIREMNAEQSAKQNKSTHELEMMKYVYQLKHTLNQ